MSGFDWLRTSESLDWKLHSDGIHTVWFSRESFAQLSGITDDAALIAKFLEWAVSTKGGPRFCLGWHGDRFSGDTVLIVRHGG